MKEASNFSELDVFEVGDRSRAESVLDESPMLAKSGAVGKVGHDVVPAHPTEIVRNHRG